MAELALDDDERYALAREFDGVSMAELVRGEGAPDAGGLGCLAELGASRSV